ncbi:MAG: Dyp-type peroxidase [Gammaproteobacteria bacterium]|nr:Dyp-type peroxidase [Gammaproteobacteria bacterium]
MTTIQNGILSDENQLARYMSFDLVNPEAVKDCLIELQEVVDGQSTVVGLGLSLTMALDAEINGLHQMPVSTSPGLDIPSTPCALWLWLRGNDRGELLHRSRMLEELLISAFELSDIVEGCQYDKNRDLSGYEDGTENPEGDEAVNVAIIQGQGDGLDGGSFVAVQQWVHDFNMLDLMSEEERDNTIGRHVSDNEEFDSAPESAHVKRSAQENFEPEAFMLRRSMPWMEGMAGGLIFVSFGKSFDAFEAVLNRMIGLDDGIQDALFNFTKPITGAYFWCPPMKNGQLDLSKLGIK